MKYYANYKDFQKKSSSVENNAKYEDSCLNSAVEAGGKDIITERVAHMIKQLKKKTEWEQQLTKTITHASRWIAEQRQGMLYADVILDIKERLRA